MAVESPDLAQVIETPIEPVRTPPQEKTGQIAERDWRWRDVDARDLGHEPRRCPEPLMVQREVGVVEPRQQGFVETTHQLEQLAADGDSVRFRLYPRDRYDLVGDLVPRASLMGLMLAEAARSRRSANLEVGADAVHDRAVAALLEVCGIHARRATRL